MSKLTDDGTLKLKNAVGKLGEAYLPIPENRNGYGKVQVKVQGSLRELQAMTDMNEAIPTGAIVEVLEVINNEILLVKKSSN